MELGNAWAPLQSVVALTLHPWTLIAGVYMFFGDNSFGYLRLSRHLAYCYISMPLWARVKLIPDDTADTGNRESRSRFLVLLQMIGRALVSYFCDLPLDLLFSVLAIFIPILYITVY